MGEWTNVKEKLPKEECNVLVLNSKGWMGPTRAIYYPEHKTFVHYSPDPYEKFTLDVTHWVKIPEQPKQE